MNGGEAARELQNMVAAIQETEARILLRICGGEEVAPTKDKTDKLGKRRNKEPYRPQKPVAVGQHEVFMTPHSI